MAEAAHAAPPRGEMDIQDQKDTFKHFVSFSLWGTLLTIMLVALLTVAFAMGFGWYAGLAAWVVIGAAAGFFMKMSGAWWVLVVGSTILFGVGGLFSLFLQ